MVETRGTDTILLQLFIVAIFTVILKETLEADLEVEGPLTTSDLQKI